MRKEIARLVARQNSLAAELKTAQDEIEMRKSEMSRLNGEVLMLTKDNEKLREEYDPSPGLLGPVHSKERDRPTATLARR
eukprot:SAG22_NODE_183_length_16031_cov_36.647000_13_plen_80_part_00